MNVRVALVRGALRYAVRALATRRDAEAGRGVPRARGISSLREVPSLMKRNVRSGSWSAGVQKEFGVLTKGGLVKPVDCEAVGDYAFRLCGRDNQGLSDAVEVLKQAVVLAEARGEAETMRGVVVDVAAEIMEEGGGRLESLYAGAVVLRSTGVEEKDSGHEVFDVCERAKNLGLFEVGSFMPPVSTLLVQCLREGDSGNVALMKLLQRYGIFNLRFKNSVEQLICIMKVMESMGFRGDGLEYGLGIARSALPGGKEVCIRVGGGSSRHCIEMHAVDVGELLKGVERMAGKDEEELVRASELEQELKEWMAVLPGPPGRGPGP